MSTATPAHTHWTSGTVAPKRQRAARLLRRAMEAVVLAEVGLSPWPLGSAEPVFELWLYVGLAVLLGLWGLRALLEGQFTWRRCPVTLCLAALFLVGVFQIIPLPRPVLERLAPATACMYDRLLPARPESLVAGEPNTPEAAPGSTLSLYPWGTRRELVRLLAILLLFAAVRNNLNPVSGLRRLALVALVNGALLALFGLVQFFTSPHNTLYWSYPSPGQVFGPFVCRSHFAFYVNVCLGLGVGLLLLRNQPRLPARAGRRRTADPDAPAITAALPTPADLLQDPAAMWVGLALALMLSSVFFCLSRGGCLALLGAATLCLGMLLFRRPGSVRAGGALLAGAVALGLLTWFGFDQIEARLTTLWKGDAIDSRLPLWSNVVQLVGDFPVWGSGYGTFQYVEPLHRPPSTSPIVVYDHAHNEYLEALVEGGVVRLTLSVLALALVFRFGWRALARPDGGAAGLAFGALFGVAAVAIHSVGDFGLHIPAVVVLVTVLSAYLCSLGDGTLRRKGRAPGEETSGRFALRLGGLAPLAGAVTLALLGLGLASEGWRAVVVERCRYAAYMLSGSARAADGDRQIAYLEQAARVAPRSAWVQAELGQAHLEVLEKRAARMDATGTTIEAVGAAAGPAAAGLSRSPLGAALSLVAAPLGGAAAWDRQTGGEREELARRHQRAGLRHYLQARDACPLMGAPHLRVASGINFLAAADPRAAYLDRAKFLTPSDPEVWYLCGLQEVLDERWEDAWRSYRRSLELSDRFLNEVLATCRARLDPAEVLREVLPDRADQLYAAAFALLPEPNDAAERRPFFEKALAALDAKSGMFRAEELHTKAVLHWRLDQPGDAVACLRAALDRKPQEADWRVELAHILRETGRLKEARGEALTVLGREPGNVRARDLLAAVERFLAENGRPAN